MKQSEQLTASFLDFLQHSPTAWHTVSQIKKALMACKFKQLEEGAAWSLTPGEKYFVIRHDSSLCAFSVPRKAPHKIHLAAAHTDAPGFKLKPLPYSRKEKLELLALEPYGSPLLASWLNRDLGIAGHAVYEGPQGLCSLLFKWDEGLIIPQLALHLSKDLDKGLVINPQEHMSVIAGLQVEGQSPYEYLKERLKKLSNGAEILSATFFVYPLEVPRRIGYPQTLISASRLDNLSGAHAVMESFADSSEPSENVLKMAIFWDHEEIGSQTHQGALSPFFTNVSERIFLSLGMSRECYLRIMSQSLCLSVDVAHAFHPGYADRYDPLHPILLGKGVVIKTHAQQRYASDPLSRAYIAKLCADHTIPSQHFSIRNDIRGGMTIGPIHAALTGMPTLDIGAPLLSMHACREIVAEQDHFALYRLLSAFY